MCPAGRQVGRRRLATVAPPVANNHHVLQVPRWLVLDFTLVSFVDSAGATVLKQLHRDLQIAGIKLCLASASGKRHQGTELRKLSGARRPTHASSCKPSICYKLLTSKNPFNLPLKYNKFHTDHMVPNIFCSSSIQFVKPFVHDYLPEHIFYIYYCLKFLCKRFHDHP